MKDTESDGLILTRRSVAFSLLILQLYPLYLVRSAYRQVPKFMVIFMDLLDASMPLPPVTQVLQSTYRWWIVIPIVTTGLAAACFTPRVRTMRLPMLTLALTLISSFVMRTVLVEGSLAPMLMIISRLAE